MRLLACPDCHRQFDVTHVTEDVVKCACGAQIANEIHTPVEAKVSRCGSCGAGLDAEAERCDYCAAEIVRDPGQLSLICPECYARNEEASRFCTACGVGFDPHSVLEDGVELPCPVCGGLMSVRAVGGVAVNECPNCNGLWVPSDHFDQLVARALDAVRNAQTEGTAVPDPRVSGGNPAGQSVQYRKCPVCEAFMQRRNYLKTSGVILDRCHEHGTWLDADELERICGFLLSGGADRPLPESMVERPIPIPIPSRELSREAPMSSLVSLLASLLR